ncbi:hypothetical protein FH972_010422 [Carpinus fangiana]|uniref:Wall-associated receptor kinase galacturonan-binding domain-containing protein n=1 Tax=Carpinus fangiana TaxID=176857 RepID=A0A660KN80_9ROSI|nr:hypothetical protein FH972_010422 [Carpinus fangiana]
MARGIMALIIVAVVVIVHQTCSGSEPDLDSYYQHCPGSSCGILYINYPFRLTSDPENCGDPRYNLSCENDQTVLYLYDGRYYVREIDYTNYRILVVDPVFVDGYDSFIPRYFLDTSNFSLGDPYDLDTFTRVFFVKCEKPVNSKHHLNTSACFEDDGVVVDSSKRYRYVVLSGSALDLGDLCQIDQISFASWLDLPYDQDLRTISCSFVHDPSLWNFYLSWDEYEVGRPGEPGETYESKVSNYLKE